MDFIHIPQTPNSLNPQTQLASGYGNINNSAIASFDPALYSNGFYTLELTATDIKGRTSTTEIIVEVEGDDKKAQYQRVDTDLSLDFNGTTIDLTRRYDSLQRHESGSFGNGWASSWNFDLETDVEIRGTGNEAVKPFETGTRLYLTLPDGERVGFTFQPVPEEITGLTYYRPAWVADAGVNYTLESTDVLLSKAGDRFYDLQTAKSYSLEGEKDTAYTLTATDGTIYQLNATGELQSQATSDGTRLIYSDSGILNPESGEMVRFESDAAGRLTNITAPDGTSVIYDYDEAGNLISVRAFRETPLPGDSVRYSYGEKGLNLIAGDTGEAVAYFDTPVVKPITKDLGTASSFTGLTTTGSGNDLYSFALRESELKSTNTGLVLLGVDTGSGELPVIEGLTPVSSTDGFALFAIDREGLNLLSVNGDYELQLGIAGDVNNDNAVNGVDSQLVTDAIGKSAGDAGYDRTLDLNRDRTIDATDLQILGSNYGFRYNQAPVVTDGEAITHEDLSVEIPLADLADDPEGDKPYGMASQRTFFKATDVQHGQVIFTPDGQTAIFKPYVGYTGTASFKLFADDGYGVSDAAVVSIQVSDAPLTGMDFVERNPKLEVGEQVELQVVADFADQEDVILPGDYLNWSSEKTGVATISDRGVITGVSNGTTIFSVKRNGLSAVTASRVGQAEIPGTEAELNTAIAETYGLQVYPETMTLTEGMTRQILVGLTNDFAEPNLTDGETGTRYFVSNPEVLTVDENGLITTLAEGTAEVTVVNGGAEEVIPVSVETPHIGATTLGIDGGIVQNDDGSQVMIPELGLIKDTTVNLTTLNAEELSLPLPGGFEFAGAFNLDLGSKDSLILPAQVAIPADEVAAFAGVNPETTVDNGSSEDLLIAKVPVGSPGINDNPRELAITKDGSRAYVSLQFSGGVAVVDPILLQQLDTNPDLGGINPIKLPGSASPRGIIVDSRDKYAYIADGNQGLIYVLDIDPNSQTYHQVIKNIQVNPAPAGLRDLAISSDGRKLFATAPNAKGSDDQSQIIVVNIDPEDKPLDSDDINSQKWQEQIGKVAADNGAEGITASSTANILTFTNRRNESKGYGVLKVTNDDPLNFTATVNYAQLSLGGFDDYFDVNEAVSITLTKDGRYGFVAGFNGSLFGSGIESIDGVQAGSNIGIIENPLGNNPILVAATRPIPMGLTTDLTLSEDDRYLYASYPGNGGIYTFDVAEITKTLSNPGNYIIDDVGRPISSPFFNPEKQKAASIFDLGSIPIDDINPNISVAADYGIVKEDRVRNQFTYGPFPDSTRLPVNPGGTPRELITTPVDLVDLKAFPDDVTDSTPTFTWSFDVPKEEIKEVNLFVSTFAEGEGLFPWDEVIDFEQEDLAPELTKEEEKALLTESWHGYDDFNPGRILTATWKQDTNAWYLYDGKTQIAQIEGEVANNSTSLTLPDELALTTGQDYHWAVRAITTTGEIDTESSQFSTVAPPSNSPFSSVTVITHGFTQDPSNTGIPDSHYDLADKIVSAGGKEPDEKGLILRYDKKTGNWIPVDKNGRILLDLTGGLSTSDPNYLSTLAANIQAEYEHKPLVLLNEWSLGRESVIRDSGFTEGAADAIFASMVNFDQAFAVNDGISDDSEKIYNEQTGELIRNQGDLLNSPLHFIGFSRGAVVNSEIIQRFGTYYPLAGGFTTDSDGQKIDGSGDLQMTTIDPHDFDQSTLGPFRDFREPKIQIWSNVTFADNYYQDLANPDAIGLTPNGRGIPNLPAAEQQKQPQPAGLNFPKNKAGKLLGQPDLTIHLNDPNNTRTGFEKDYFNPITKETPHGQVFAWYSGTVDLGLDRIEVEEIQSFSTTPTGTYDIYDQLGEGGLSPEELNSTSVPWYSSEGSREGWFYSVLGGGKEKRPHSDVERVPVSFDNTLEARMRGDFAVPTLFNGNYDASFDPDSYFRKAFPKFGSFAIPGWGLHNLSNKDTVDTEDLVEWSKIPSLSEPRIVVDYKKINGQVIDKNNNVIDNLNILSLTNSLLDSGYTEENGKLVTPTGTIVEGFEFDLLINELIDIGYTIDEDNNLRYPDIHESKPGEVVVGIKTEELAEELGYTTDGNNSLIDQNGNKVLDVSTRGRLRRQLAIPIKESYFDRLGLDKNTYTNYALKLEGGDSITHNRFVVPDWGTLRFDLHVPEVEIFQPGIEYPDLKVFMKSNEPNAQEYELSSRIVAKDVANSRTGQRIKGVEIAFDDDFANSGYAENRIGFGSAGFETFNLDIPDALRNKVATLRFELEDSDEEVYLDNVFFQSQHLLFGNPTDARIKFDPYPADGLTEVHDDNRENFLVEKPQYTISYNDITKNPNWVSWQLNKSWLGAESRTNKFEQDHTLPSNWNKVQGDRDINGNPDSSPSKERHNRGHLAPSGDRTRNEKDNYATFLMSNMVPQNSQNNQLPIWWLGLEDYSRNLVESGKELYIIAGGQGQKSTLRSPNGYSINVPERLWKVIVVMNQPGQTIADVNKDTMAFAIDIPNIDPDDDNTVNPNDWKDYVVPVQTIENRLGTNYDFLSNVPTQIQEKIESRPKNEIINWINANDLTSPLLADVETSNTDLSTIGTNATIRHDGFVEDSIVKTNFVKSFDPTQIGVTKVDIFETCFAKSSVSKNGSSKIDVFEANLPENSVRKVNPFHKAVHETTLVHTNPTEIGGTQINLPKMTPIEVGFAKVGSGVNTASESFASKISSPKTLPSEILFSPSVESNQFFSIHDSTPKITDVLNNSATNIWSDLLQSETPLNIDFQITDLPSGQLAEATITGFDDSGKPNAGTILIDQDANGVGWFIDETPLDNSEFTTHLSSNGENTDSYLLATADSEADGKYDLLTTVLHELSHLYGFIDGYQGYNDRLSSKNGTTKFIGDDFTATLDGEHLDKQAHPYDLLNTHLAPGMRKLPSELDVQILQALIATEFERNGNKPAGEELLAKLTSDPLLGITNGDFSISDTTTNTYAWNTRGDSKIESGQAVLTEDSPFLSNFSQTFTVPEDAKTIQFKLIETELGASELAPPDAFEVALLDANTHESLVTDNDLTETDSLLNIQNDGTAYFSDQVRIGGATSGELINLDKSRTVTIDISNLTPGTEATLYFDLLGFGDVDSRVVIDDVRLSDQNLLPPTAVDDIATTTQGEAKVIDILANDSDDDGTIAPESVQIQTEPEHGSVIARPDGTVSYLTNPRFAGTDSFTYVVQDNDGQLSEAATVTVEVKNAAPKITEINIPDRITEGDEVTLKAIATDAGSDELTYTWDFGDGETATGTDSHITHTFTKNGDYKLMRIRSNCCLWSKPTSYSGIGKSKKHDRKFKVNDQSNFLNLV